MSDIGIFISYNHKDRKIAQAISESLSAISPRLEPFIDYSGLEGGDDYEKELANAIARSQWFILIHSSDKNMNWCFYEAGQFRSKLQAPGASPYTRMCYLYDTIPPRQLTKYQGTNVALVNRSGQPLDIDTDDDSLDLEETELFGLFHQFLEKSEAEPLRDVGDAIVRKLMRVGVKKVIRAFARNKVDEVVNEIVYQSRIFFTIPPLPLGPPAAAAPPA